MDTAASELPHIVCLLRDSLPLEQDDVSVCFDPARFARKTNPAQEQAIDSQWRRQCRQNPRLFNGSKFRYAGLRWTGAPQLQLGLTSYREHIGTNCRAGQRLLQEAGAAVHGDRQAFLADPLGVGALLLTADNRLAFVRRALWTGEYPGRLDRPGGHAEPDELPRAELAEPAAVLDEVFESVRRELRDELGVPLTHLSRAYLTGVLRDRDMGGRPTLEFVVRCSLPSSELERIYNEGKHAEADESLGLVFLTRLELFSDSCVIRVPELDEVDAECPGVAREAAVAPAAADVNCTGPERDDGAAVHHCEEEQAGEAAAHAEEPKAPAAAGPPVRGKEAPKKRRRNKKDKKAAAAAARSEAAQPAGTGEAGGPRLRSESLANNVSSQLVASDAALADATSSSADAVLPSAEPGNPASAADAGDTQESLEAALARVELGSAAAETDEIVVVQQNGVVLLKTGEQVTETVMPTAPLSGQIETLAEVVNNPEVNAPEGADAATAEKSVEEAERERKAKLWEEMTPACRGSLMLLKQVQLKGFVFRF
ncbi:uncharacterized protein LOC119093719 [Pollicipes pollicipes]|uniref:uncharacterized protein LOC119093719 n=1 Tax=Pollicipes pollicipes TaxID=41117 RepID=UPI00188554D7|nr:uncharacterized protein LOC119093719 [Pollicipes pollicipes]